MKQKSKVSFLEGKVVYITLKNDIDSNDLKRSVLKAGVVYRAYKVEDNFDYIIEVGDDYHFIQLGSIYFDIVKELKPHPMKDKIIRWAEGDDVAYLSSPIGYPDWNAKGISGYTIVEPELPEHIDKPLDFGVILEAINSDMTDKEKVSEICRFVGEVD